MALLSGVFSANSSRKVYVDILAILFGISSWISINGLWVELPLLVERLPESWSLASYLSIIVQMANIGPITYGLIKWRSKGEIPVSGIIVLLLMVGITSSSLLVAFWHQTSYLGDLEHSTGLFVLVFFLSLVDCTSSVLFLPFMGIFRDIYLNSYLVGEGLSGFIPSIAALIQGVGGNPYCTNVTIQNETSGLLDYEYERVVPDPRFSVEAFFIFLASLMVISLMSFLVLNYYPGSREELADKHEIVPSEEAPNNMWISDHRGEFMILMFIQTYVCFFSNGALPSIQTYSCLPYGNTVYHLSVTMHAMANPVMAFLAFFMPCSKTRSILALTAVGSIFVAFLLATALYSPDMFLGQDVGGTLTVLSWILYGGLFAYVKVSVAGICRQKSNSALFWCGAVTQIGSAFGALLMFLLVNVASGIFTSYQVTC